MNNNKNIVFDEDKLLLGHALTQLFMYNVFYNEEEVLLFGEDKPSDSNKNTPFYDFEKNKTEIDNIYDSRRVWPPSCYDSDLCCKLEHLQRENQILKKALLNMYNMSNSLNETVKNVNEMWNISYEDLLDNLAPMIYYLLSQYSLSLPVPSEGMEASIGKINIPKPNIDIPKSKINIPTIEEIKKKSRKIAPKLDKVSTDVIERVFRNIFNLPHDEYKFIFKNKGKGDNAPLKALIMVAKNAGTIGKDNSCKKSYTTIEERILAEVKYAEDIWGNVFKLDYKIEYLSYDLNTGDWFEEIIQLPNGEIIYLREQDTLERINKNTFDYISKQIEQGSLTDIDIVFVYVGNMGLYKNDLGITNAVGNCRSYINYFKKDFNIIVVCDASINYTSILAHEIGHALYFTNVNENSTDPNPIAQNPGHNKESNNLMYPYVSCSTIPVTSDIQIIKIGESTLFKD